ncbi:MAG: hypothetical protein HQ453_14300 [Actinobacteria bacterium]|nr:hypothetical protein [Actinomycetota bacterium]
MCTDAEQRATDSVTSSSITLLNRDSADSLRDSAPVFGVFAATVDFAGIADSVIG